ncbi:MAG: hypothetical protein QXJ17_08260 [Nitrososphaeria archaeon]
MKEPLLLQIIQNPRRKHLIELLIDQNGEIDIKEAVDIIAKFETKGEPPSRVKKSIYVSMVQTHIPFMENVGLIKYVPEENKIRLNRVPRRLKYYLEVSEEGDISWPSYYIILSITGLVLSMIIWNLVAIIFSSLTLISALVHLRTIYKLEEAKEPQLKERNT